MIRAEAALQRPLGAPTGLRRAEANRRAAAANNRIVCLSACRDEQTSKDDRFGGVRRGAFTWALHSVLDKVGMHSELLWLMRRVQETLGEAGYTQMPQLAARLKTGESLEHYHLFESLQEAADAPVMGKALPTEAI